MKPNRIKKIWQNQQAVLNGWLSIPDSFSAEIMARQGWDSLTIDLQHGMSDFSNALFMLQAIATTETVPLVRIPWLEAGIAMKVLDAGAYGIICPMINHRAQAETLMSYLRYPPAGLRSFGPTRANFSAGADYARKCADELIALAMIETREALDNLAEIVKTDGLDGVYIGPADLSLALGFQPGFDREEPEILSAIYKIRDAAHRNGKKAGIHNGSPQYAAKMVKEGFDFVTIASDARFLASAAQQAIQAFRTPQDKPSKDVDKSAY